MSEKKDTEIRTVDHTKSGRYPYNADNYTTDMIRINTRDIEGLFASQDEIVDHVNKVKVAIAMQNEQIGRNRAGIFKVGAGIVGLLIGGFFAARRIREQNDEISELQYEVEKLKTEHETEKMRYSNFNTK